MKFYELFQFILTAVLFALAGVMCVSQVILMHDWTVAALLFALWCGTGALAYMSWTELTGKEDEQ